MISVRIALVSSLLLTSLSLASAQSDSSSSGQKMPWQTDAPSLSAHPSNTVQFLAPVQVDVPANKPSTVELQFRVADGYHINSHAPHSSSLIATQVLVAESSGLKTENIDFPGGVDTTFSFAPDQKINVYTGEFALTAHIVPSAGKHTWQGILRYQACDKEVCLPPRKLPVAFDVIAK